MQWELLLGRNWGQRALILVTIAVYLYLFLARPDDARRSLTGGLKMLAGLFTLILAAVLLASAIQTLIPAEVIQQHLGAEAGFTGVLTGGLLGGLLQGGPYGVYPIIRGLQEEGMSIAGVLAMLIGYGAIGGGRIVYGITFFESKIVAVRVALGIGLTILASLILYTVFTRLG